MMILGSGQGWSDVAGKEASEAGAPLRFSPVSGVVALIMCCTGHDSARTWYH
jgi:hypothetical protein